MWWKKEKSVRTSLTSMNNDGPLMNFRELGGYKLKNGKRIRKGYIYRGRALDKLNEKSIAYLNSLHFDYVFDLRDEDNQKEKPDYRLPGVKYVSCPIIDSLAMKGDKNPVDLDKIVQVLDEGAWSKADFQEALRNFKIMYEKMPFSKAFSPIFEALNEGKRIYIHCTGGKDRTGVACMMILWALGASDKTVWKDYRLSNRYRRKRNLWRIKSGFKKSGHLYSIHYLRKCMICSYSHFKSVKKVIFSKHGTIESFLEGEFTINHKMIEKWREFYTK